MSGFPVQDGQCFVFQGDSITDAGRRDAAAPFGAGYVSMFIERVTAHCPERSVRYINKGIGGDNTNGLRNRWDDDVIRHQPDWLSILIGINDLHEALGPVEPRITADVYRDNYDYILSATRERTNAKIVLLDPFYISIDHSGQSLRSTVLEVIEEYIAVVHEMVEKYETHHVKLHEVFKEHLKHREAEAFCPEPVHPNHCGHMVMADALFGELASVGGC